MLEELKTESEGMEKYISWKWKWQDCTGSNALSYKIDFKTKSIIKVKEGLYIIIKGLIQEGGIILLNIYAPNTGVPKYLKQY